MDIINICEEKDSIELVIEKNSNIFIFNKKIKNIIIRVLDGIKVNVNEFNDLNKLDRNIKIIVGNNSLVVYNLSNIVNKQSKLDVDIDYKGNNSKVSVNIHSIVNGYEKINIVGNIENEYKDNLLLEDVKVMLIDNGMCEVNPVMTIDTNSVNASHKVAISNIRKEELLYLMGKCLDKNSAEVLLKKSFLLSNINNQEFIKKIKNYL